ncbi:protein phosphatase 1 regulatory subunit 16A isoform X2 [Plutella xylostella]|uniref:protein phosphatase 1 regulatory subunit 16A isoform X2 n=1 Tax=Plutella xylostella TaxID=51655 RepID=UPI0020329164|nr:protein phosphatase 1 regulatory subunit 16A isoform X2 [Plutella xylostella]
MEHSDLVLEMAQVEHLTTQERLHLARRRRMQQLKLWQQREKEWARSRGKKEKSTKRNIYFDDSVMLLEAAARSDIEEVRRLLARGVTPDATNEDGLTALHQCCIDNNEAMMRLLLQHGADVNAEDSERWTPLHAAATCGNLALVRILIQRGANLLAVNGDGNMPYDICEEERTLDAIESEMAARGVTQRLIDDTRAATEMKMLTDVMELYKEGADLDEPRDNQGATLLHIASANGYIKVVEFLLENRAATDVVDHDMWQPVHAAACWGHLEVLELLVQYGADLNVRNKHDETPADICEEGEMRARILRLAAEQEESRRRAAAAAARHSGGERLRGARRSSSTASSSRVRSVRRTSLREKQLAAKADARGEARLRETFDTVLDDDLQGLSNGVENDQNSLNLLHEPRLSASTASTHSHDSDYAVPKHNNYPDEHYYKNNNPLFGVNAASHYAPAPISDATETKHYEKQIPNGVRKAPEGQDNEAYAIEEVDGRKELVVSPNQMALTDGGTATYTTDNNGTLADLKKQRSQIRTNGSPVESSVTSTNGNSINSIPENLPEAMPVQQNPLTLSPSSGTVPRFSGHTSDVVGDTRSRRCCIVM